MNFARCSSLRLLWKAVTSVSEVAWRAVSPRRGNRLAAAAAVAAAASAMERRDLRLIEGQGSRRMTFTPQPLMAGPAPAAPLGQTYRRPAQPRRSARRDG